MRGQRVELARTAIGTAAANQLVCLNFPRFHRYNLMFVSLEKPLRQFDAMNIPTNADRNEQFITSVPHTHCVAPRRSWVLREVFHGFAEEAKTQSFPSPTFGGSSTSRNSLALKNYAPVERESRKWSKTDVIESNIQRVRNRTSRDLSRYSEKSAQICRFELLLLKKKTRASSE
jgi:hypothetical protein